MIPPGGTEDGARAEFFVYEYSDDAVGNVLDEEHPVAFLLNREDRQGICLSREDAQRLGLALLNAAVVPRGQE